MSHNVSLENVKIRDIDALRQAVSELSQETGVDMEILENAEIRSYSHHNPSYGGPIENGDYVLRIDGCRFDIGFNRQADGTLQPRMESMGHSDFGQILGTEHGATTARDAGAVCDLRGPGAAIGRLLQRVTVITMEREAVQNGLTTKREYDKQTKVMALVSTGRPV